jgi:hypothetical protein
LPLIVGKPRASHCMKLPADLRSAGCNRELIQNVNRA